MKFFWLFFPLVAQAQIYQWTDSQGRVHFSDKSQQSAIVVQLPPSAVSQVSSNNVVTRDNQKQASQALQIIQPVNGATLFNNEGTVLVKIALQPSLQNNTHLIILLDNKPIIKTHELTFDLENIDRGEHFLQVQVIDASEKILKTSTKVVFYLHRTISREG